DLNVDRKAVFQAATNFGFAGGTELVFSLSCHDEIACFRISLTTATNAVADALPRQVRAALELPRAQRTPNKKRPSSAIGEARSLSSRRPTRVLNNCGKNIL